MPFPILEQYLHRLQNKQENSTRIWIDEEARVQGKFSGCSLSSVFHPVADLASRRILAYDALTHSYAKDDQGLSVWQLLMRAANDEESVELDRLARLIHVMNFFRQNPDPRSTVLIDVHDRLLAAISSHHGLAFRNIMEGLGLPLSRIVLQLPFANATKNWALALVVENYKKSGFRVATRAAHIDEALDQLDTLRPHIIRLNMAAISTAEKLAVLIRRSAILDVRLLFVRVETDTELTLLQQASSDAATEARQLLIQGPLCGSFSPQLGSANHRLVKNVGHENFHAGRLSQLAC